MSEVTAARSQDKSASAEQAIKHSRGLLGSIVGALPTVVVLAALASVAVYGHYNGWKIPKSSAWLSNVTEEVEWCPEHGVPEKDCIECVPSLLPSEHDFGWCKEHGVHQCPHCHPEVAQLKEAPQPANLHSKYISLALATKDRQENNLGCNLYRSRVQFASIDAVRKAGIDVEPAEIQEMVESVTANGELTYDETRVAHVSTRADGIVYQVDRKVGDSVKRGDLLALADSTVVGNTKAALLDALAQADFHSKTVARSLLLSKTRTISDAQLQEDETRLEQAEIQVNRSAQALANLGMQVDVAALRQLNESARWDAVRFLGIPAELGQELQSSTVSNNLIPVFSPIDGLITQRHIVQGEVVSTSDMLFQVVDTSVLWLRLRVALEDAKHLRSGQLVSFRADGTKDRLDSRISWISTDVDPSTRTVEVRCDVPNDPQQLRNETFGTGEIILRQSAQAVVVPSEAVQWDGSCFVVFVRDKDYFKEDHPKLFHPRSVRPGVVSGGRTEIIAGLLAGEVVATRGSSVLRSQILKNNLGAGCTCGH